MGITWQRRADVSVRRLTDFLRIGPLGRNTLTTSVGLGSRALIQALYLIVISRWLGPHEYGLFAGSVAAAILLSPLSGWGVTYMLSRRIARDQSTANGMWATALRQSLWSGIALTGLLTLIAFFFLQRRLDLELMILLGLSELLVLPLTRAVASSCMALGRAGWAGVVVCVVPAGRLIVCAAFWCWGLSASSGTVAVLHFTGTVIGCSTALAIMTAIAGTPEWRKAMPVRKATSAGTSYAMSLFVGLSYQEADKVLILQMLGATLAGVYTVSFRVVSVFVLPVSALMSAALPRLFATHGEQNDRHMLRTVLLTAFAYAVPATLLLLALAPLVPSVIGHDFKETPHYIMLLSPWIVLFAVHQAAATGLTAFGRQRTRVFVEAIGLVCVVVLNAVLLPVMGLEGSIVALLCSELVVAIGCLLGYLRAPDAAATG